MLTLKTKSLSFSRPTSPNRSRSHASTATASASSALPSPASEAPAQPPPQAEPGPAVSRRVTPPPSAAAEKARPHSSSSSSGGGSSSRRASPRGVHLVALTPAVADEVAGATAANGGPLLPPQQQQQQRRGASQERGAFRGPIRSLSANVTAVRSKSSDRVSDLSGGGNGTLGGTAGAGGAGSAAAAPGASSKRLGGAGGFMASIGKAGKAGLRLTHSQSQPGSSRHSHQHITSAAESEQALLSPTLASSTTGFPSPSLGSGAATPQTPGGPGSTTNIEQFAESFIAKVSLRLGECVNRMFVQAPHGPGGTVNKQLELAEAPYGGNGVQWKSRPAPRLVMAREFGERIAAELQAAHHDSYLLRTLLRSSILKTLSLFFTRLSALLLVPSTTEAALHPSVFAAPRSLKDLDSLPLALRYNLHIVRCAYEVKRALSLVADPNVGVAFPPFVDETLKPWRAKLAELMNRVMNPLVQSARAHIAETCLHARATKHGECAVLHCLHCRDAAHAPAGTNSALGLHGLTAPAPVAHAGKVSATSQLRSLSLGRASPAPSAASHATKEAQSGAGAADAQYLSSPWIRDLSAQFDALAKLIGRLGCGVDADKWIVSVATAATWKGMLNLAARPIEPPAPGKTPSVAGSSESGGVRSPVADKPKRGLLGGTKKPPSPPQSPPPLPANGAAKDLTAANGDSSSMAAADAAFARLLYDIESLETRLKAFLGASLSTPAHVLAPAFGNAADCPATGTATGCNLCRTGRVFDDDSSDSSDDEDENGATSDGHSHRPGHESARESKLALSAMREAMQALSALVVTARASHQVDILREAIEAGDASLAPQAATPGFEVPEAMTPSTLFARTGAPPSAIPPSTSKTAAKAPAPPAASLQPSLATCPTLKSALVTLPPLILLHLVAARISTPPLRKDSVSVEQTLAFRLPHEVWALRGGWTEYAAELRGFAAGEDWAPEVAAEMASEARRVVELRREVNALAKADELALETLVVVARTAAASP